MEDSIYYYNDNWKGNYIHPDLLTRDWELIPYEFKNRGVGTDIYSIPVFNENFCNEIISIAESAPEGETIQEINGETIIVNGWGKERHKGEYNE